MNVYRNGKPYVKCELCEAFATKDNAAKLDWSLFTGRLAETVHYCAKHKGGLHYRETMRRADVRE